LAAIPPIVSAELGERSNLTSAQNPALFLYPCLVSLGKHLIVLSYQFLYIAAQLNLRLSDEERRALLATFVPREVELLFVLPQEGARTRCLVRQLDRSR